jgi:hypothetical protein
VAAELDVINAMETRAIFHLLKNPFDVVVLEALWMGLSISKELTEGIVLILIPPNRKWSRHLCG